MNDPKAPAPRAAQRLVRFSTAWEVEGSQGSIVDTSETRVSASRAGRGRGRTLERQHPYAGRLNARLSRPPRPRNSAPTRPSIPCTVQARQIGDRLVRPCRNSQPARERGWLDTAQPSGGGLKWADSRPTGVAADTAPQCGNAVIEQCPPKGGEAGRQSTPGRPEVRPEQSLVEAPPEHHGDDSKPSPELAAGANGGHVWTAFRSSTMPTFANIRCSLH